MHSSLRLFVHIVSAAGCFAARMPAADTVPDQRPNILFIFSDDQSYKTLSCYEGTPPWVRTPNIDRIAERGVRFERSYLGAWCMPSRASVLTGHLQHAVRSLTITDSYPDSTYDPAACPFVPAQFRIQGYQTAQIGKWHVGSDTGFGRDWDYQIVWNRPRDPGNTGYFYPKSLTFDGQDRPVEGYSTDNYTRWVVDYLMNSDRQRDPDKPWYLWLCYTTPHRPTTPAGRHRRMLAGNRAPVPTDFVGPWPDKPAYLERKKAWMIAPDGTAAMGRKIRSPDDGTVISMEPVMSYDTWIQQVNECMASLDEGVGRILAALEASGQIGNTLVVYAADQGFGLGEHGFNDKFAAYDSTVASPLILSWPGRIPEGKVSKHPINAPDLVDFFCRAAGVTLPWRTHGRDIRPLLSNPETTDWDSSMLMTHTGRSFGSETAEIPTDSRLTAGGGVPWYVLLRKGKYKYIRTLLAGETEEIYDLEADPEELVNLAELPVHGKLLKELRAKAIVELRRTDASFVNRMPPTKAEREAGGRL